MPRPSISPGYGQVRLRKKGRFWYARFSTQGRRWELPLRVTNKVIAETKARQINEALEKGEPWEWMVGRTSPHERSFAQVVGEYLEKGSRWAETTRHQNRSTIAALVREWGDRPVSKLKQADIEAYLARRRDEGLSKASRNRYLCALKVILGKAQEWGYVKENIAAGIRTEREDAKLPRPYREEEIEALLVALQPHHADIARLYLHTGLRRGELAALRWADVDFESGMLTIRRTKSGRDRTVPMSDTVRRILEQRRRARGRAPVVALTDDGLVFGPAADIRQVLERAMRRAGFDEARRKGLRPIHSLRDTCLTRLAARLPLRLVQEIAGHASPTMTARYAEVSDAAKQEAIRAVFG